MTIVVGLDGSPAGSAALQWAAGRAEQLGPVRPVLAWDYPVAPFLPGPLAGGAAPPVETMQAAAEQAAAGFLAEIEGSHEDAVVRMGPAPEVILQAAGDADLIVVGCRSRGRVRKYFLGSTSRQLLQHSTVPVVLVPEPDDDHRDDTDGTRPQRVLVGIDGSEHSVDALRWALAHTRPDDVVTAVTSWKIPVGIGYDIPQFDREHLRAAATETVRDATEACGEAGERVVREIAEGDPRWVLSRLGDDADLLVLGARGRTGLAHLLLGSTTTALTHAPTLPTVVVPSVGQTD